MINEFGPAGLGKGWLKVRQVAKHLDCSKSQVYDLVHEGELQAFKHGQLLRISVDSLEAFVERHRVEADEAAAGGGTI
ncbi:MAG: helix-turn-helix domain-containing protein [Desulfobaccales bacterium]